VATCKPEYPSFDEDSEQDYALQIRDGVIIHGLNSFLKPEPKMKRDRNKNALLILLMITISIDR